MSLITPRTLSGFRDRLPKDAILKQDILQKLTEVFRSFGFVPIETPHLEYAEILVKQGSEEIQKELYRFKDHGERDVALRFDLTVPLARFISQHRGELGLPFKRYAYGNVFRGERAQRGRYREFTQCDFDFIGSDSTYSDAETIMVIYSSLKAIGIDRFCININNRKIMNGICEEIGASDKIESILRIVDKIEKIGEESVKKELKEELGLEEKEIGFLIDFINFKEVDGDSFGLLEKISTLCSNEKISLGIRELKEVLGYLEIAGIEKGCYKIDLSIARGLGYYTGIVYETFLDGKRDIGSVSSGGRYDNLTATFSKEAMSGVGASIGIDRLMAAIENESCAKETTAEVLIVPICQEGFDLAIRCGSFFRSKGVAIEIFPEVAKPKKGLNYANKKGHKFAVIIGEDEAKEGKVTIKNLIDGEQSNMLSLEESVALVKS